MKDLTSGIYCFEDLIQGIFLYVDKTEYIWQLIRPAQGLYSLFCPRRLGKSLTLSTLKAVFERKKALFKGLGEKPAEDLITLIGFILKKIHKAVSRQFAGKEFALPIEPQLGKALKQVLGGLLKVAINVRDLEAEFQSGGPAKLNEIQQCFTGSIEKVTCGKDPNKTRIVLE